MAKKDTSATINSLSKNNNFDLVISYCIENDIYDINIINDYIDTFK